MHVPTFDKGQLLVDKSHYIQNVAGVAAQVVDTDSTLDLAVLQLDKLPEGLIALPLASHSPAPGDRIHSLGNPSASDALWVPRSTHRGVKSDDERSIVHVFVARLEPLDKHLSWCRPQPLYTKSRSSAPLAIAMSDETPRNDAARSKSRMASNPRAIISVRRANSLSRWSRRQFATNVWDNLGDADLVLVAFSL